MLRVLGLLAPVGLLSASAALAADINAGPIWNNMDAQSKCPNVCSAAGGTWTGNWVTIVPGQSSVCKCDIAHGGGGGGGGTRDFDAGPIWSNMDAQGKCPGVCSSQNRKWTGDWRTTDPGRNSTCTCSR